MQNVFRQKNDFPIVMLICMLLISHLAMLLSLSIGIVSLERLCSYIILFVSFGIYIYSYIRDPFVYKQDLIFIALVIYLIMLAVVYSWSYDDIVSILVFLSMLTTWRGARVINCNKMIEKLLLNLFSIQGLFLIALYFTPLAYKSYQEYVLVSSELTLGFSNPNQTGIILFFSLVILLILMSRCLISKARKIFLLTQIVALSFLLILTDARTSILSYLLFLFFFLKKKKVKIHSLISSAIIVFPIVFVYLYDMLSKTVLSNVVFWGKKLFSGRQRVFEETLSMFDSKLFGNLSYFQFRNSHNALLTILVNIGVVGFILYLVFTIMSVNSLNRKCKINNNSICIIAILMMFIMGCAETAVLTGGTIYYVFMLVMLILSNNELKKQEEAVS